MLDDQWRPVVRARGLLYDGGERFPKDRSEPRQRHHPSLATRIMSNGVEVIVRDGDNDKSPRRDERATNVRIAATATLNVATEDDKSQHFQVTKTAYNAIPKVEKRIDELQSSYSHDLIQPSEPTTATVPSCSMTSCPCTVTYTESLKDSNLKTKLADDDDTPLQLKRSPLKPTKYGSTIVDTSPTDYGSIKDKIDANVEPQRKNQTIKPNIDDKKKPGEISEKEPPKQPPPMKINNNKFEVAELLKLGIKSLAPMIQKWNLGKEKEKQTTTTTSTLRPVTKITPYIVNKRHDDFPAMDPHKKISSNPFPIYIPVEERDIEAAESQNVYYNVTLQQNLNTRTSNHIGGFSKLTVHESPLVNGGIPISPGEIITANSDVIVGKPAVGGPNIGHIKPSINNKPQLVVQDSYVQASSPHNVRAKPPPMPPPPRPQGAVKQIPFIRDDSFDLRPPSMPPHLKPVKVFHDHVGGSIHPPASPDSIILENHGRPAFLDYIPQLDGPGYVKNNLITRKHHNDHAVNNQNVINKNKDVVNKVTFVNQNQKIPPEPISSEFPLKSSTMPLLVDVQPSKVANVIIPHGSSTALIFAGSTEPHKNGEYIDDPLPYSEPGYFGSFSIEAPQLTSIQIKPNGPQFPNQIPLRHNNHPEPQVVNHGASGLNKEIHPPHGQRWKYEHGQNKMPPPMSNQEANLQFGPHFPRKPENLDSSANTVHPTFFPGGNNAVRATTADYEKDLVAPPPPPPTVQVKFESNVGVLNSHNNDHPNRPFPMRHNEEASPPKITSEVYFASSSQQNQGQKIKPFMVNLPPQNPSPNFNSFDGGLVTLNAGTKVNIPNIPNVPNFNAIPPSTNTNHYSVPQNGGLITVNAGASVFNPNLPEQTISGSSSSLSNEIMKEFHGESAGIPIGTNFAIKVEPQIIEEYIPSSNFIPHPDKGPEIIMGGNNWKAGSDSSTNIVIDSVLNSNQKVHVVHATNFGNSTNSHANFPSLMQQNSAEKYHNFYTNTNTTQQRPLLVQTQVRPAPRPEDYHQKPHPSQSNIVYDTTTHKIIPLTFDYESERYGTGNNKHHRVPFGQKIPSVGHPPTNWQQQQQQQQTRPVLNPKPNIHVMPPTMTTPTYNSAFIPANFNSNRQPAYDIPTRDHHQTTFKPPPFNATKFITNNFITTNEYKTIDESDYNPEESVKVPVVSSTPHTLTNEVTVNFRPYNNSSETFIHSENDYHRKPSFNADDNTGSQTEKPFNPNQYKEVSLVTLPGTRHTTQPTYNVPNFSQMAPRPFSQSESSTINTIHYDKTKPRPFQKPAESDADKMVLNIGEMRPTTSERPPQTTPHKAQRPLISLKNNTVTYKNEMDKIITSSVNIAANKPLRISNTTTTERTTTTKKANISTMISNLSPPPPTMDYSFKPSASTNNAEEAILGMSPPPKTPSPIKPVDTSTYRPGYNPYKRPGGDFYRVTNRPFTRYTTPSSTSQGGNRIKVTPGTTITRLVFPSRSTAWKNPPVRIETKVTPNKQTTIQFIKTQSPSVINTTPLATVGADIMHPDVYPEETIAMTSLRSSIVNLTPEKVHNTPLIYSTISKPGFTREPIGTIETSENFLDENAIRTTETLRISPTVREKTPERTILHELSVKPIHHAGNEIKQSDVRSKPFIQPTTVITLTTTIAEPASTVMTTRFVTLTHTLTVTQTQTSIVTPEVGSTTQTLVLTNTKTSTVVDVVTQIQTLVQPVTIVQTITKHVPITTLPAWETKYPKVPLEPTRVIEHPYRTKEVIKLDDVSLSSDEEDFIITPDNSTAITLDETHQSDNDTFFVVMNKSQNGGRIPNVIPEDSEEQPTRNEEVGNDGVSHVLLGEILLAGTPYLETSHVSPTGAAYGKECQPDCKASRNERCQRMHGLMKCVCRPGFARMFPDRPCKPTYTYSMKMALSRYGNERLLYQDSFADQNSKDFQDLAMAAHEGINRMVMQSDLRDVYHGVHINGFQPVKIPMPNGKYMNGVLNDFYVQLSDNAHETRLKEVIEKYLRHNNYSLGGTDVYAAGELVDKLEVGDFNECMSGQFHDCSEHAECFNLRATYTCSCKEGYADLSVNPLYPGRICSAEPVGCEKCNYHGTCYTRDDSRVLCECFQWYSGETCAINLKMILISLATLGAILFTLLLICIIMTCAKRRRPHRDMDGPRRSQIPPNVVSACIGNLPTIHQGGMHPSKMHVTLDKRALIQERGNDSGGEGSSIHNASLPYVPAKKISQASHKSSKKTSLGEEKKPFTLMIPRAKYHPAPAGSALMMSNSDLRESSRTRKPSGENINESKLLSYLDAGPNEHHARRKPSNDSSYSMNKSIPQKYSTGALISAGFKVSTTVMGGMSGDRDSCLKDIPDDESSIAKSNTLPTLDMQSQFNSLRKAYSQEDINDWTDAERRIGELTMSEARSFDGTLVKPSTKLIRSTTGSNKSSAHYTQHEANTMAERDLGSTFLLPHVHLYKPDMGSDVSEFDSL